jgi:hypothetical protein
VLEAIDELVIAEEDSQVSILRDDEYQRIGMSLTETKGASMPGSQTERRNF